MVSAEKMHFLDVRRDPKSAARRILEAIDEAEGSVHQGAAVLGVSRTSMYRWVEYLTAEIPTFARDIEKLTKKHADAIREKKVIAGRSHGGGKAA